MKNKKIMATVLVATMAIASFNACSKKEETTTSKEQETVETSETTTETTESETTTESTTEETTVETTAPAEDELVPLSFFGYDTADPYAYLTTDMFGFYAVGAAKQMSFYRVPGETVGYRVLVASMDEDDPENEYTMIDLSDSSNSVSCKLYIAQNVESAAEEQPYVIVLQINDNYLAVQHFAALYYNADKGCFEGYSYGEKCSVYYDSQHMIKYVYEEQS